MIRIIFFVLICSFSINLAVAETIPENDNGPALVLTTPNNSSAVYNFTALPALLINQSTNSNFSNFFNTGIYLKTNSTKADWGRGMIINNFGPSDALYIENEGHIYSGGIGIAVLNDRSGFTGIDIGNRGNGTGLLLEQDSNKTNAAENLMTVQNEQNAPIEMLRIKSAYDGSVGIIFRMSTWSTPIAVKDTLGNDIANIYNDGTIHAKNGYRLESPNGTQYIIKVTNTGSLYTCKNC